MIVKKLESMRDVYVVQESYHKDERGYTFTIQSEDYGLPCRFVLTKAITGRRGATRGFHGDWTTWKLFGVVDGSIDLVLLDVRPGAGGQMKRFRLTKKNRLQVLVPPGVANAHQGNSRYALVYHWSEPYNIGGQFSIHPAAWDWKHKPILSDRDKNAPTLESYLNAQN